MDSPCIIADSQVEHCDASKFLATFGGGQLDVITAADVLPYMGDLSTLFKGASSALKSGGLFVLTTEEMVRNPRPVSNQLMA
jgi:predicted TPR repeat methyltransferase